MNSRKGGTTYVHEEATQEVCGAKVEKCLCKGSPVGPTVLGREPRKSAGGFRPNGAFVFLNM